MSTPTLKYILATFIIIITFSCTDVDPLQPEGAILSTDEIDIIFDPLFTFQSETQTIKIRNIGDTRLIIDKITIDDNTMEEFSFELSSSEIPVGGEGELSVTFSPSDFARFNRNLIIQSNSENDVLIRLDGTGVPKVSNQELWSFTSQSSIDSFKNEKFDIVNTNEIQISSTANINDPVTDLSALSIIEQVERLRINNNSTLVDLKGLQDLKVTEELVVEFNTALVTLNDLKGLDSEDVINITIEGNSNFEDLSFLSSLTLIGDLKLINNRKLASLVGLENIDTIDGDLVIFDNDNLVSLDGIEGLSIPVADENVDGEMMRIIDDISIRNNPNLINYCGLTPVLTGSDAFYGTVIIDNNELDIPLADLQAGICN